MAELFSSAATTATGMPLAARMRPTEAADFVGQEHLLQPNMPLGDCLHHGQLHSMVLWGPPGCGKTTLAGLLAAGAGVRLVAISAMLSGVRDIRQAVELAERERREHDHGTVLFVDEVHRFNKAQQDSFLPHVENGTIILIGATTENPSFELTAALLSRLRVYVLRPLDEVQLVTLLKRACSSEQSQLVAPDESGLQRIAALSGGDARRAMNLLEVYSELARAHPDDDPESLLRRVLDGASPGLFDKRGEQFYDQISALHKSVRGSSPDAALYWLSRMLEGGCDPLYIARRVVRIASEDIGNADPRALRLALDAWEAQERLGSPEGELSLAQAVIYMACASKSNACYRAFGAAREDARKHGRHTVPMHLRNAPTGLMKSLGYGKGYRYAHDEDDGYAAGEHYFPTEMGNPRYYHPVARGLEQRIAQRLKELRDRDLGSHDSVSESLPQHPDKG